MNTTNDTTPPTSPGHAVFRALYGWMHSDAFFAGSTAFRCDHIAEAAIAASGLREKVKELEGKIEETEKRLKEKP